MSTENVIFINGLFRIIETKIQVNKEFRYHRTLERRYTNTLGEVYFAPIPEYDYGNVDMMRLIIDHYKNFVNSIGDRS